jgi:hypothetical protein
VKLGLMVALICKGQLGFYHPFSYIQICWRY